MVSEAFLFFVLIFFCSLFFQMHSTDSGTEPTKEMVEFFEERTKRHIAMVQRNINLLIKHYPELEVEGQLHDRGRVHDSSKWSDEEKSGYVWLTHAHKTKCFEYPNEEIRALVERSVEKHLKKNRHHSEYHNDANEMSLTDLYEMVCDWAAISQEMEDDDFASPRKYFEEKGSKKYGFNEENCRKIQQIIQILEKCLSEEKSQKKIK